MNRTRAALYISAAMAVVASIASGCSDLGDSSAIPDQDANAPDGPVTAEDGAANQPDAGQVGKGVDAAGDGSAAPDSGVEDAGNLDSTVEDTGVADTSTGSQDSGVQDSGSQDTGTLDSALGDTRTPGSEDTGTPGSAIDDAGAPEAATEDTGALDLDTGASDAGTPEAGGPDAGSLDSASAEAGIEDAGVTADASEGAALLPCTTAAQTGCVPCAANTTGLCTPTEAALVQHDIDEGNASADAGETQAGCYDCLSIAGCIDDDAFGDKGNECGDLTGTFGTGAQAGTADSTLCLDTLACVLSMSCAGSSAGVSICYCGATHAGSVCATAGSAVNGACVTPEVNGLGFDTSDNVDILKNFTDKTRPTGMANELFQCAISNTCTSCLQ